MRIFQIVLEIIWVLLGLFCIFLGVRTLGAGGRVPATFFVLSAIAFGMAIFRHMSRRRQEQRNRIRQ